MRSADYLKYFAGYPENIQAQVKTLIESHQLARYFEKKYPDKHYFQSEKALLNYTNEIKNRYLKIFIQHFQMSFQYLVSIIKNRKLAKCILLNQENQ